MYVYIEEKAPYIICAVMGYLIGCLNAGYIIGQLHGRDIRKAGSHNAGATNTLIVIGLKAGLFVAAFDILKAVFAVSLARMLFGSFEFGPELAGACCIFGHAYPFWMGFRGGKGFASYLGLILASSGWLAFFGAVGATAAITLVGDKIAVATISIMVIYPVAMHFTGFSGASVCVVALASAAMIFRHRENIGRLLRGEEMGLRQFRARKRMGEVATDDK